MFDHPVEVGVEHVFDLIELKLAALGGDAEAPAAFDAKVAELKESLLHLGSSPATAPTPRADASVPWDKAPSPDTTKASTMSQLAILGVGVDLVFLPRLRSLVSRQAQRIASAPVRGAWAAAPHTALRQDEAPHSAVLAAAAQHFARRTLSPSESALWKRVSPCMPMEERIAFLATR